MKTIFTISFICFLVFNTFAQNFNLTNVSTFEGEPYLAINPTNPQNIAVAWMGYVFGGGTSLSIKTKMSVNGGLTWSSTQIIPHKSSSFKSADPTMAFDATGKLFLAYIDYRQSPDSGGVYLVTSNDGGATWSSPTLVISALADGSKIPLDRPWLTVDNAGNTICVTTKPAPWVSPPNRPYFTNSTNGGMSFNQWRYLDTTNYLVGNNIAAPMAVPAITGNTLIAIYPSYLPSQSPFAKYILAKTTNSGGTFTYSTVINNPFNSGASNDSAKLSYRLIVNPSNSNHYVFTIIGSLSGVDLDVYIIETLDGGVTWSAPLRVNDDALNNGKMQDLVWTSFDTNGDLAITWRDRRNGAGSGYARSSEIYAAYRASNSATFTPNFKISNTLEAYGNALSQNGNDVMCVVLKNDTLHATWGSTRDGSLDIWYSKTSVKTGQTTDVKLINSESLTIKAFPNPVTNFLNIISHNNLPINKIEVYDMMGKLMYTEKLFNSQKINLSNLDNGTYELKVYQENMISTEKIIKTH